MRHASGGWRQAATSLLIFLLVTATVAEESVLVLSITDLGQHPFADIQIGTAGGSGSPQFSDQNGKARLKLAPNTKPDSWVTLQILNAPNGIDLVFISPFDGRVRVPPFDNEQENYDPVIVIKRGDLSMLQTGEGMLALHATANRTVAQKPKPKPTASGSQSCNGCGGSFGVPRLLNAAWHEPLPVSNEANPQAAAIAAAAQHFGLPASAAREAIADWGGNALVWKLIELTGTIETGGGDPFTFVRAVNSDVMFGVATSSLRECTLQPLLLKLQDRDSKRFAEIFGADTDWLSKTMSAPCESSSKDAAERMLAGPGTLQPAWRARFRQLGREPVFQRVSVQQMMQRMQQAQSLANSMGLASEQALAFVYDTVVQVGPAGIRSQQQYLAADVAAFKQQIGRAPDEQEKLLMLANQLIQWRQSHDPQLAPSFIARARFFSQGTGPVYGQEYDLSQFGIGFRDVETGAEIPLHNDPAILAKLEAGWTPPDGNPPSVTTYDATGEHELLTLVNQERTRRGLSELQPDPRLTQAARQHSSEMAAHGTTSHQFPGEPPLQQRYKDIDQRTTLYGENLVKTTSVALANRHFMTDPDHQVIMLGPDFNAVGVGIVRSGGVLYVTEDFAHLQQDVGNEEAANLVRKALESQAAAQGISLPAPKPLPELQPMVCKMAANNALDLDAPLVLPGANGVMGWPAADPSQVSPSAVQTIAQSSGYSLATCHAPSPQHAGGTYWTVLVVY